MNKLLHVAMILALFGAGCASTAPPTPIAEADFSAGIADRAEAIAAAAGVTQAAYADADEVLVDRAKRVRYHADGTYVQWDERYVKILTEKGRRGNLTLSTYFTIPYQRGVQDCRVSLLEVIKPDGRVVPVDIEANSRLMINSASMSPTPGPIWKPAPEKPKA